MPAPPPVRLRPVTDRSIGTTAFFRNRPLLDVVCAELAALARPELHVLFHACSNGAEVYSFLIACREHPVLSDVRVQVTATDLEPEFVQMARFGIYPEQILGGMSATEARHFTTDAPGTVRVSDSLIEAVRFLPAGSFVDFDTKERFDATFLLNALLYVPGERQPGVFDRMGAYTRALIVTTGFHFDAIRADMQRIGFVPVLDQQEAVHDAWLDRRRPVTSPSEVVPGKIFHTWSLPPFSAIDEVEYRYCAVFRSGDK